MFCITPAPTFEAPLKLAVPGKSEPAVMHVTWKHKTADEAEAWTKRCSNAERSQILGLLMEVMAGWRDVFTADGNAVPFGDAALGQLLQAYPGADAVVLATYIKELSAARQKN